MKINKFFLSGLLCVALVCVGALFAQKPAESIDSHAHPNLAEAQRHILQAWEKADEAQKENKDELGGHAQKAKEHLEQADRELKLAAEFANQRK